MYHVETPLLPEVQLSKQNLEFYFKSICMICRYQFPPPPPPKKKRKKRNYHKPSCTLNVRIKKHFSLIIYVLASSISSDMPSTCSLCTDTCVKFPYLSCSRSQVQQVHRGNTYNSERWHHSHITIYDRITASRPSLTGSVELCTPGM